MSLNITQFVTSWRSLEQTWRMVGTRPSVKSSRMVTPGLIKQVASATFPPFQLFIGVLCQSQRSLQYFLPNTCNGGSSWLHAYGVTKHDINKENTSVFFFEWQRNGQTVCHLEFSTGISKLMITQPGVIHGSPRYCNCKNDSNTSLCSEKRNLHFEPLKYSAPQKISIKFQYN